MKRRGHSLRHLRRQSGFTLLETLIALGIGLFLLGGIVLVMGLTRQNFNTQSGMSQLQDDQRIAISMLVLATQHAGFFPNPQGQTATNAFAAGSGFVSGQAVGGTSGSGSTFDTLSVRYVQSPPGTAISDAMMDCNGITNPTGANRMTVSTFALNTSGELTCAVTTGTTTSPAQPLAAGISGFSVLYGVDSDNNGSVDQYLAASAMTSALWLLVESVRVSVTFVNPLDSTRPITVARVINLMN